MTQNKLSFQSQNLIVDWISFKFQHLSRPRKKEIANYLSGIGFNSYKIPGKLSKPNKESIKVNSENKLEVFFVIDAPHLKNSINLQFSGLNARKLYSLIKNESFSWELFSDATIGRLDLHYRRENKKHDLNSVNEFLQSCYEKIRQTIKTVILEKNQQGFILKTGNRKGNHFSRIYERKDSLKFEYEMKGQFISKIFTILKTKNLEELENQLSKQFLSYFEKLLPLNYYYTDWLVVELSPIRKQKLSSLSLKTNYIHKFRTLGKLIYLFSTIKRKRKGQLNKLIDKNLVEKN
uniref:Uncharacterized protein n=1 Tax=Nitzschia supralitorea TaxID=303403 RepID=A0A8F1B7C0_9STRA|nr:hypothetical protein KYU99_pgp065 [Nitzschia supralitorea]QWM93178.1 hypothetical protein [Nitzschia supralitorea]